MTLSSNHLGIIVGGGVAGIVAAILLKEKYRDVWLIEKEADIGGLYSSLSCELGVSFDHGSHFLRTTGLAPLDKILYGDIDEENWRILGNLKGGAFYGGRLNGETQFVDARRLPPDQYYRGMVELLSCPQAPAGFATLDEQLRATFGPTLTDHLFRPILCDKYYGCTLSELAPNSHALVGLARILGFDSSASAELKKSAIYDSRLAYHSSTQGTSSHRNFYPIRQGIGAWVDQLKAKLADLGIHILTRTSVSGVKMLAGEPVSLTLSDGQSVSCDRLIWTIPVPLFLKSSGRSLPAPISPMKRLYTSVYHFAFDRPFLTDVHYVHCHDPALTTFRVTLYPNIQQYRSDIYHLTSEVISPTAPNPDQLKQQCVAELRQMGIVSSDANILFQDAEIIAEGFPLPTLTFQENSRKLLDEARNISDRVIFLGRSAGNAFTADALLVDVYNAIQRIDAA